MRISWSTSYGNHSERLRREYDLDLISTYPSVVYRVHLTTGTILEVDNPLDLPDTTEILKIEEPNDIGKNSRSKSAALVTYWLW